MRTSGISQRPGGSGELGKTIFCKDQSGSVVVIAALALPLVLGFAALAVEYGSGLMRQVEKQRVADASAFAAALAYTQGGSDADMRDVAYQVAGLHGFEPDALTVELTTVPGGSSQAVRVHIETRRPLFLASLLGVEPFLGIGAQAFAGIGDPAGACIIALDPSGTGVGTSGTVTVSADDCVIASNASVTAPCGTDVVTKAVSYNSTPPSDCPTRVNLRDPNGGAAITSQKPVSDPLTGHPRVEEFRARLGFVDALRPRTPPVVPTGTDIVFGPIRTERTIHDLAAIGCDAHTWDGYYWQVYCGDGVHNFGSFSTQGSAVSVDFTGGGNAVYNFSGPVELNGNRIVFSVGTYNMAQGLTVTGNAEVQFAMGTYNIARSSSNCSSSGVRASMCLVGASSLTIGGPSTFNLYAGIQMMGAARAVLGESARGNAYYIGTSSSNTAIALHGTSKLHMRDSTGEPYTILGDIESRPQTCLTIGAAAHHDIRGSVDIHSGTYLGFGTYTIHGYFAAGSHEAGPVFCEGVWISLHADNVHMVMSGRRVITAGPCASASFCIGPGYRDFVLTSPKNGYYASLTVIGPENNASSAVFAGPTGAGRIGGLMYYPNGPVFFASGSNASHVRENCLQLIGTRVAMSGENSAVSECIESPDGGGRVSLVQ